MELDRSETYLIITAPEKKQSEIFERIGRNDKVDLCVCDNVYQAMAETFKLLSEGNLQSGKLIVVMVWADTLTLGQMELFTLLKEHDSVVTLAVSNNNESKLQTSLKAGADRAMFLDNLRPGLFDSIVGGGRSEKRGRTPLIDESNIRVCEEETYSLLEDEEMRIIEVPAEKGGAGKDGDDGEIVERKKVEDKSNKGLTDISLSDDELRSLLEE